MIKERLQALIEQSFQECARNGDFGDLLQCPEAIVIETPKAPEHGDFACGLAMKIARHARKAPLQIAELLAERARAMESCRSGAIESIAVAPPGFINFRLGNTWLCDTVSNIHEKGDDFGKPSNIEKKKILLEYVSANPTGALHIGHGRGAVFGSCLANLLKYCGHDLSQEFYVNDTGAQIEQLTQCAWACYQRKLGREVDYPADSYPEEYLQDYIDTLIEEHGKSFLDQDPQVASNSVGELTKEIIRADQEQLLLRLGIKFDRWFSEKSLHESDMVEQILGQLEDSSFCYEKDGALHLRSTDLGDTRDRVLRKQSGHLTYLAADAAYHKNKFERGYDLLINIWGADHHGQVPSLKATMKALGYEPEKLEIILTQIVNLSRDGEIVRMSKRRGTVVMLEEVLDEVGADAVRYFLAESNPQNPINFDLELAKKSSRENPAFYIQYAHARCCSIMRRAVEPVPGDEIKPVLSESEIEILKNKWATNAASLAPAFDSTDSEAFAHQKALVLRLSALESEIAEAEKTWQPGKLARYAYDLACDLQKFYEVSRVISDDLSVTRARLGLIMATRQVLANVLEIIGVSAPDRM